MFQNFSTNQKLSPSFSKQQMDLAKAKKMANGNHWLPLLCDHKGGR
jgi:hypothetical protein